VDGRQPWPVDARPDTHLDRCLVADRHARLPVGRRGDRGPGRPRSIDAARAAALRAV